MKICIIGKYPPIQGGVSKAVFNTCHELAKKGHQIHVISNAEEVEASYRLILGKEDSGKLSEQYGEGWVKVHPMTDMQAPEYTHIPFSPAFESRLFGKGLEILSNNEVEVIVGWYFQPYAVVASQLSKEFDIPLVLIHAGSDIGRLIHHPELKYAYHNALEQADCILSSWDAEPGNTLAKMGVPKEKVIENIRGNYLSKSFSGKHKPLPLNKYKGMAEDWIQSLGIKPGIKEDLVQNNIQKFHPNAPILAIYGKVGVVKGSFDLIQALGELAKEGYVFNFLTIPLGKTPTLNLYFQKILDNPELAENTFIIPPMASWRIPSFIAACDAVFFLERDFDIEFHTPQIPLEILAGGSCLVCSKEIIDKQFYKSILIDGNNYIEIKNPKNISEFKRKIKKLLKSQDELEGMGRRAKITYDAIENELDKEYPFVESMEKCFEMVKRKKSKLKSLDEILQYENDFVIECFRKEYEVSKKEARDIFKETLKWLYLCAYSKENPHPSTPYLGLFEGNLIIDKMWHSFILCTYDYHQFCNKYLGEYIHHQPTSVKEHLDYEEKMKSKPKKTKKKAKKELLDILGYVYDVLGKNTVEKWYSTYPIKYPMEMMT